jgi:hypothetical protein
MGIQSKASVKHYAQNQRLVPQIHFANACEGLRCGPSCYCSDTPMLTTL